MNAMKRLTTVSIVLLLVGCASMMGDRTVRVSNAQIQEKLNEKLSTPISLLKVFEVSSSNALVTFDESSGRMHTMMDADLSSAVFSQQLSGKLGPSGQLRFDAASSSIVLDKPAIEQLDLGEANQQYSNVLIALAKVMSDDLLQGLTLYKVKPEDLKVGATQYRPKNLAITSRGLQITLSPQ